MQEEEDEGGDTISLDEAGGEDREKCEKGNDVINQGGETSEQKKGSRR